MGAFSGCSIPLLQIAGAQIGVPPTDKVAAGDVALGVDMSGKALALRAPGGGFAVNAGTVEVVESLITAYAAMWTKFPFIGMLRAGAVTMRNTTPGDATPTECSATESNMVGTLGVAGGGGLTVPCVMGNFVDRLAVRIAGGPFKFFPAFHALLGSAFDVVKCVVARVEVTVKVRAQTCSDQTDGTKAAKTGYPDGAPAAVREGARVIECH